MPARPGFHFTGEGKGNRLTPKQVMALAHKYGLPPKAMMQIAKGESGLDASVQQRDPGDGMVGYGLLQMTPNAWGKGSAAYKYMQRLGGIQALSDPETNMKMARFLYRSAGNSFKPWYGTRYLTDRSGEGSLGPVRKGLQVPGLSGGGGGSVQAGSPGTTPNVAELLSTLVGAKQSRPQTALPPVLSFSAQASTPDAALPEGYQPDEAAVEPPQAEPDYGQILSQLTGLIGGTVQQQQPGSGEHTIGVKGSEGSRNPSKLYELFWNGPGAANVKNGEVVPKGFVSGHTDHVHVASNQKALLKLGALAQSMGLHVGENPAFGGVDPVHVKDSFHYGRTKGDEHDRAIDVSGDVAAMRKFANRVKRIYRL